MIALIIEDEVPIAEQYEKYLTSLGYQVTIVDRLASAIGLIKAIPNIEIITLDCNLLDSRATETIERIKEIREHNPSAMLIVISGVLTQVDVDRAIKYGADGIIEKVDIPTDKTFFQKLKDIFTKNPLNTKYSLLLETLTKKITERIP